MFKMSGSKELEIGFWGTINNKSIKMKKKTKIKIKIENDFNFKEYPNPIENCEIKFLQIKLTNKENVFKNN